MIFLTLSILKFSRFTCGFYEVSSVKTMLRRGGSPWGTVFGAVTSPASCFSVWFPVWNHQHPKKSDGRRKPWWRWFTKMVPWKIPHFPGSRAIPIPPSPPAHWGFALYFGLFFIFHFPEWQTYSQLWSIKFSHSSCYFKAIRNRQSNSVNLLHFCLFLPFNPDSSQTLEQPANIVSATCKKLPAENPKAIQITRFINSDLG